MRDKDYSVVLCKLSKVNFPDSCKFFLNEIVAVPTAPKNDSKRLLLSAISVVLSHKTPALERQRSWVQILLE